MALWKAAGVDPSAGSGAWYRETGSGMGATLNAAVGMGAYALTDRGDLDQLQEQGRLSRSLSRATRTCSTSTA